MWKLIVKKGQSRKKDIFHIYISPPQCMLSYKCYSWMLWQMKKLYNVCNKSSATHSDLYQYSCIPHAMCCTSVHCSILLSSLCLFVKHFSKYISQSSLTDINVSNEQAKSDWVLSSKQNKHLSVHWAPCTELQHQSLNTADHKTTHECCSPHPVGFCHIHAAVCIIVHVFMNAADGLKT